MKQENVLAADLLSRRTQLLGFIRSKVQDPQLAEDILQDSLLKALRAAPSLREEEKIVPWFYRIVRNSITDYYRRSTTRRKHLDAYLEEAEVAVSAEDEATLCACFRDLIPTLKDEYQEVIEKVELQGEDPGEFSELLGITPNNLKVRRHRARQQLRARLEEVCRTCARHGCLDCTCQSATTGV